MAEKKKFVVELKDVGRNNNNETFTIETLGGVFFGDEIIERAKKYLMSSARLKGVLKSEDREWVSAYQSPKGSLNSTAAIYGSKVRLIMAATSPSPYRLPGQGIFNWQKALSGKRRRD